MIAIVGSGKFTNFLIKNLDKKNYLLISGTKKQDVKRIWLVGCWQKDVNRIIIQIALKREGGEQWYLLINSRLDIRRCSILFGKHFTDSRYLILGRNN